MVKVFAEFSRRYFNQIENFRIRIYDANQFFQSESPLCFFLVDYGVIEVDAYHPFKVESFLFLRFKLCDLLLESSAVVFVGIEESFV